MSSLAKLLCNWSETSINCRYQSHILRPNIAHYMIWLYDRHSTLDQSKYWKFRQSEFPVFCKETTSTLRAVLLIIYLEPESWIDLLLIKSLNIIHRFIRLLVICICASRSTSVDARWYFVLLHCYICSDSKSLCELNKQVFNLIHVFCSSSPFMSSVLRTHIYKYKLKSACVWQQWLITFLADQWKSSIDRLSLSNVF